MKLLIRLGTHSSLFFVILLSACVNKTNTPIKQSDQKQFESNLTTTTLIKNHKEWRDPIVGIEFVNVAQGCFMMGGHSEEEKQLIITRRGKDKYNKHYKSETPRHQVCVDNFWMGKYEVTVGQFKKFIAASSYQTDSDKNGCYLSYMQMRSRAHNWQNLMFAQDDNHPVVCISWRDAEAFVKWLNKESPTPVTYRLPTEAEWEYAARAGTSTNFYWGNEVNNMCDYANMISSEHWTPNKNVCKESYLNTAPVGSFQPNPLGLYDMSGNVSELMSDWSNKDHYSNSPKYNPLSPKVNEYRLIRGGSWVAYPLDARSGARVAVSTIGAPETSLGFRVIREANASDKDIKDTHAITVPLTNNAINKTSQYNQKASLSLMLAAGAGDLQLIKGYLRKKADINFLYKGLTPLLAAIGSKRNQAAKMLIDKGANIDGPKGAVMSPLIGAVSEGLNDIAILLIEKGANIHAEDANGMNALAHAELNNSNPDMVLLLKKAIQN